MIKTNAMRMLDSAAISYRVVEYEVDENDLSGIHVANQLGQNPEQIFKTLVLHGDKTGYAVCCIPVDKELDLKKAAKVIGDKKISMIQVKELQKVTGYIRGGCSPVGMKKKFPTYIDGTAKLFAEIYVSAGIRGAQLAVVPDTLAEYIQAAFADLTEE